MKDISRFLLLAFSVIVLISCEKEAFINSPSATLDFSTDTVAFDTVFTTIGSVTRHFKVYNPHKQALKVSSIYLANGQNTGFRLNIDGEPVNKLDNVEIPGRDSLYIFVEITIDPSQSNNPLLITDSIVFLSNGNRQDVKLVAWGQDVHFFSEETIETSIWKADKPYLIYNWIEIAPGHTLTIEAGAKIHFHRFSSMVVSGTLVVNGTKDNPVIFQGDRLEKDFRYIPGQWGTIALTDSSADHSIHYAEIRNSIVGLQVGEYNGENAPSVEISNTIIENPSYVGIFSFNSTILGYNLLINGCGSYAIALLMGGTYLFDHITVANYSNGFSNRRDPAVAMTNFFYYEPDQGKQWYYGDLNVLFRNSIIYGDLAEDDEIGFGISPDEVRDFNFQFENCLIKANPVWGDSLPSLFTSVVFEKDPGFRSVEREKFDFRLDSLSPARDIANPEVSAFYPLDLAGENRLEDGLPDLGTFEWRPIPPEPEE